MVESCRVVDDDSFDELFCIHEKIRDDISEIQMFRDQSTDAKLSRTTYEIIYGVPSPYFEGENRQREFAFRNISHTAKLSCWVQIFKAAKVIPSPRASSCQTKGDIYLIDSPFFRCLPLGSFIDSQQDGRERRQLYR